MKRSKDRPLVSVIMPVFNAEEFLSESIQSVLSQTYENLEFIVINDGSNDQSDIIINEFVEKDSRIKYIKRENRGIAKTLNEAIDMASGKYIARMDADDISYSNRINVQVNYLEKHQEIDLCGAFASINGKKIFRTAKSMSEITAYAFFWCPFIHPTVMWRTGVLKDKNLRYSENEIAEDYDLWVRALTKINMCNIPKPLLFYRVHNANISSTRQRERLLADERIKAIYCKNLGVEYTLSKPFYSTNLSIKELAEREQLASDIFYKLKIKRFSKSILKCMTDLYLANEIVSINNIVNRMKSIFGKETLGIYSRIYIRLYIIYRVAKEKGRR